MVTDRLVREVSLQGFQKKSTGFRAEIHGLDSGPRYEVRNPARSLSYRLGGVTFGENSVPPWTRGDFRGVLGVTQNLIWVFGEPTPALRDRCRVGEGFSSLHPLPTEGIFIGGSASEPLLLWLPFW